MNKTILHIALPSIAANITLPLLNLADLAITGHLGATAYMGAVAVGGSAFSLVYWLFGFLRMGTSGLTAQALGGGNEKEAQHILGRSLLFALVGTILLLLFQRPLAEVAFAIFDAEGKVDTWARTYFSYLIWGTPAILGQYALTGWFIGWGNTRLPLLVSLVQNTFNIPASLFFVFYWEWKIEDIAAGTLLSQYLGLLLSIYFLVARYGAQRWKWQPTQLFQKKDLLRFFHVHRDIFFRSLFLLSVMAYFTRVGASMGEIVLAANALLLQFYLFASYVLDGLACAGQVLGGRAVGDADRAMWNEAVRKVFLWSALLAAGFSLVYGIEGEALLSLLTNKTAVVATALPYLPYATALPLLSFAAFIWDGFYVGATATRLMLLSVAISAALFFATYHLAATIYGNHALWTALLLFLFARSALQTLFAPRIF